MIRLMTDSTDKRFILLHPDDNVYVCCQAVGANDVLVLEGDKFTLNEAIEVGHKLSRRAINTGEKIIRYGVSIGSAKADIARAEHVHLHNIKSDYMPSHQRSGIVDDNPG